MSHRVHEVLFGVIFAQAMVGAVSQLRNPIGRRAGMLQTLAALVGFVVALAAIGVVELLGVGVRRACDHGHGPPPGRSRRMERIVASRSAGLWSWPFRALVPLVLMAVDNFAKARSRPRIT